MREATPKQMLPDSIDETNLDALELFYFEKYSWFIYKNCKNKDEKKRVYGLLTTLEHLLNEQADKEGV